MGVIRTVRSTQFTYCAVTRVIQFTIDDKPLILLIAQLTQILDFLSFFLSFFHSFFLSVFFFLSFFSFLTFFFPFLSFFLFFLSFFSFFFFFLSFFLSFYCVFLLRSYQGYSINNRRQTFNS